MSIIFEEWGGCLSFKNKDGKIENCADNLNKIYQQNRKPMIKPLNKYIVCKRKEKEKSPSTILMLNEEPSNEYVVVVVSHDVDGVSEGDTVLIDKYQGREIDVVGEQLFFVHIQHVIAKI